MLCFSTVSALEKRLTERQSGTEGKKNAHSLVCISLNQSELSWPDAATVALQCWEATTAPGGGGER